ncbi:hypothetical protein HanXRQr2_Chr05g0214801 [Helianthus annuus]|uniref:Uncharacterized protein n=1 Tax=Helianthus annuus TaxID=4232 RepID=A0A9K3NMP0_HELAN|nr:hypothetical protein HanXRQr2_Chr05g0214801 [Helianthus annuus]
MFILCMTENRGGADQLNITQSAAFTCLITNAPFNYSKYIFEGMKRNVTGVRKDKFLMYPRFLQMILNVRYPDLMRSGDTLELKPMGPACFGALTLKKGTEKKFEGLIPLEKFGQFAETEDVVADPVIVQPVAVNAMVAEEHDVQGAVADEPETEILTINSDDGGIEIMCDSGDDEELPPENEADIAVSTVPSVITAESLALLLKSMTDKMGNPPSDLTVSNEEPDENPKDPDSLPLKRKRRDPRLGMYVEQNKDQPVCTAEDDDGLYDFDFEKNVTDTTTTTEDIFEFNTDSQRDVLETATADVQVTNVNVNVDTAVETMPLGVSESAGPSRVVLDMPSSSSGKRPEEPFRMPFEDDSSDDDDFISMREMKKRLIVVEQDSIHKDAKIIQLEDTIVQKNQQIEQLQGDVSLLFNMVYDLRGKLEKKFGNEFSDPKDVENRRKAFDKDDAERSASMEKYFERVIDPIAEKEKAERIKKKREFVILKNKNLNPDDDDDDAQATHHLMDVGETLYDKVGNGSGVVSWGFDHDRRRWWIKRKVGPVEWYKAPAQFQTFTKIDLTNLSNAPYVDDKPGGRGHLFYERLKREVLRGFPSMHTAESLVKPVKGVRDPYTNKRMKVVHWPATDKEKVIPLVRKIPKGALKSLHFWAYDERLGQTVIVCDDDVNFRLVDQVDLLNLAYEDLEVLAQNQIRATEKYEEIAKGWTAAVASAIHIRTKGFGGLKDRLGGARDG